LAANPGLLTAVANDLRYDDVFAHQIERYGRQGDSLMIVSVSGESLNIVNALRMAKVRRMTCIAFTGASPNTASSLADYCIAVRSQVAAVVETCHVGLIHAMTALLHQSSCSGSN
jgi:phosphoheptose isomerase